MFVGIRYQVLAHGAIPLPSVVTRHVVVDENGLVIVLRNGNRSGRGA